MARGEGGVSMSDEVAFDACYEATRRRLLDRLTLLTTDCDAAQDVLQDAYGLRQYVPKP